MPAAGEFFVEKYGSFFIFLQIFHGLAGRQGAAAPPLATPLGGRGWRAKRGLYMFAQREQGGACAAE